MLTHSIKTNRSIKLNKWLVKSQYFSARSTLHERQLPQPPKWKYEPVRYLLSHKRSFNWHYAPLEHKEQTHHSNNVTFVLHLTYETWSSPIQQNRWLTIVHLMPSLRSQSIYCACNGKACCCTAPSFPIISLTDSAEFKSPPADFHWFYAANASMITDLDWVWTRCHTSLFLASQIATNM